MTRRNKREDAGRHQPRAAPGDSRAVLSRLTDGEAAAVLDALLKRHDDLLEEAGQLAIALVNTSSCAEIASEVADAVNALDSQDLNGRAGATPCGYTEPTEAAWELLEESVEDFVADLKRRAEVGPVHHRGGAEFGCANGLTIRTPS